MAAGRGAARLARDLEVALASLEISLSQYRALARLSEGGLGASVVADELTISRPTVSALIDGLVARGLVDRAQDAADRRRVILTLTRAGVRALQAADAAVADRLAELASQLPAGERDPAIGSLASWATARGAEQEVKHARGHVR